jgi:hypothetical protein
VVKFTIATVLVVVDCLLLSQRLPNLETIKQMSKSVLWKALND